MKAIFFKSFLDNAAGRNNLEIKHFSLGKGASAGDLNINNRDKLFDLTSIWESSSNILRLSLLFNEEAADSLIDCNIIYIYYAIFDQENEEENIAFVLVNEDFSNIKFDKERNFVNVKLDFPVNSKISTKLPELNSDVNFLEGAGISVGENLFRLGENSSEVSRDSYLKYLYSTLTSTKIKGPNSSTGLDEEGKSINLVKFRKIYKEESFTLGVFDETYYINISDKIKTKYNLPREITFDTILSNESPRGAYCTLKLTGSIDYDIYYMSDTEPIYIQSGSDEITGIDGIKIINVEKGQGFTFEIDNLLYNINYYTPEGVDINDQLVNPYGIFELELTYTDLEGKTNTIKSNKLRLIQGGYYGYFSVISRDSNYTYPVNDAAMYLFNRKSGERKYFTVRIKSPIFTEYWENDEHEKIKSNISFEFENDYMERELKKLFNFSYTITKLEDLEDVFDIEVEILTLQNNNDPDHWLPFCDPDSDGVNESVLSMIKLNVDLDTTNNLYFERFYCAQGNQSNSIILSDLNKPTYERSLVKLNEGLVYRNDEGEKVLSITEEFDNIEDIELENTPFYWKIISKPEELTIRPIEDNEVIDEEIKKGEGEFNQNVRDYFTSEGGITVKQNQFKLIFDYSQFLGTFELPNSLSIIKLTREEYLNDFEIEDTWETFLTYNIIKLPVKKEGKRPYVEIEGAELNSKGTELVLELNTNPIRVEKVKVTYNATITVELICNENTDNDNRYKLWNGSEEVDSLVIENLSGEEETTYIDIVIREVGKYKRNYTGAKIRFMYYPIGSYDTQSFQVNSSDDIITYIKLTEGVLSKNTYSLEFIDFKFNEEPGIGKGIGFAQRKLAGYKNSSGNWVSPEYDSINYLSNTADKSLSTVCDVFVPVIKVGKASFEAYFKSSVSIELETKQSISSYVLENGVVFDINQESGEYEYKYHYIKYTDPNLTLDSLVNYPASKYDVDVIIKLYNYNNDTFKASEFRLWAQKLSSEVIISSNKDLKGLSYNENDIADATIVYDYNNINEAISYIPAELNTNNYLLAWVGYKVADSSEVDYIEEGTTTIERSLVTKYAGETGDLYFTNQILHKNKLEQILSKATININTTSDLLRATSDGVDYWSSDGIIVKSGENSKSKYLTGYVLKLPSITANLNILPQDPEVIGFHKFSYQGKTRYFNWYDEITSDFTESSRDGIISDSLGNPKENYYVYLNNSGNTIQVRSNTSADSNRTYETQDFIKVTGKFYLHEHTAGSYDIYEEVGDVLRDITDDCSNISITEDSDKDGNPYLYVSFQYQGESVPKDSRQFTLVTSNGANYKFSELTNPSTSSLYRYTTNTGETLLGKINGQTFSNTYWMEARTGLIYKSKNDNYSYSHTESSTYYTYTNYTHIGGNYYIRGFNSLNENKITFSVYKSSTYNNRPVYKIECNGYKEVSTGGLIDNFKCEDQTSYIREVGYFGNTSSPYNVKIYIYRGTGNDVMQFERVEDGTVSVTFFLDSNNPGSDISGVNVKSGTIKITVGGTDYSRGIGSTSLSNVGELIKGKDNYKTGTTTTTTFKYPYLELNSGTGKYDIKYTSDRSNPQGEWTNGTSNGTWFYIKFNPNTISYGLPVYKLQDNKYIAYSNSNNDDVLATIPAKQILFSGGKYKLHHYTHGDWNSKTGWYRIDAYQVKRDYFHLFKIPNTNDYLAKIDENKSYDKSFTYNDFENNSGYYPYHTPSYFSDLSTQIFGNDYSIRSYTVSTYKSGYNSSSGSGEVKKTIIEKTMLYSGYLYRIYDFDGSHTDYWSLNNYEFNSPSLVLYRNRNCNPSSKKGESGYRFLNRQNLHAINFFTEDLIENEDLTSNFEENGMGYPYKTKGPGTSYILQERDHFYWYKVRVGMESDTITKLSLYKIGEVSIIKPDPNSNTDLTMFYYTGYFYKLGKSKYYLYSGSNGDPLAEITNIDPSIPLKDAYVDLYKEDKSKPVAERDPLVGKIFLFDNLNLPTRPKTGLMYPISEGMTEDYKDVYHIDRSELNRSESSYTDYCVIEEPVSGLTTDLYTVDYSLDAIGGERIDGWNIKLKGTGKTVTFSSVPTLPNRELKLFKYKYSIDIEDRIFSPLPEGVTQEELISENFIGNAEKELTVTVRNPDINVTIPNYVFEAEGGELSKTVRVITRGFVLDSSTKRQFPSYVSHELGYVNGLPNPNYWSSYLGYEQRYLKYTLPDRFASSHNYSSTSQISTREEKILVNQDPQYNTLELITVDGLVKSPQHTITQNGVNYAIYFIWNSWDKPYWIENSSVNVEIPDTIESKTITSFIWDLNESESFDVNIQIISDTSHIIKGIVREENTNKYRFEFNRNKSRSDKYCEIKFTNPKDSGTTFLIVKLCQKAVVDTLEVSYNIDVTNNKLINSTLIFNSDGILRNISGNSKDDGILYIKTNLLNDIVDNTLYTLTQKRNIIYNKLKITHNGKPVYYEIPVINSSIGDLYYSGEGFDDVYRTFKLINVSTLPCYSLQKSMNFNTSPLVFSCRYSNETALKTVTLSSVQGYFLVEYKSCEIDYTTIIGGYPTIKDKSTDPDNLGTIKWNTNVTNNTRPNNYSYSSYKVDRNPSIIFFTDNIDIDGDGNLEEERAFMSIPHGNELQGGSIENTPLDYLRIHVIECSDSADSFKTPQLLSDLIINNIVELKKEGVEGVYQEILQGVLNDVSYGEAPDKIVLGPDSCFVIPVDEKVYFRLLKYTTVSRDSYKIRNTITIEYKSKSLKYPLKCTLVVYFDLL